MAINLTGKSDATLVTAATRAGLATSPKSYQEIFEDVSQTYGETMQAVTESWEEVAKLTKTIGLEAVENAIRHTKKADFVESTQMSDEDGEFYIDKLQDIKKRLQGAVGLKERLKINRERDELYAQVDMFDAERKLVLNALASGNVDVEAMGANKMELLNAIAATGTKKKNTSQGNYFAATEDPLTGEIMYTLMKDPSILIDKEPKDAPVIGPRKSSQKVLGADGKPIVIRAGDAEKSIILKNPQLPIDLTKVRNNIVRSATQTGGAYTDYERDKVRKQYAPFTETSSGLIQTLRATWFDNSFYEELTSPGKDGSELSAIIFDTISKAKGANEKGLVKEGILANVEDKNDDGFINKEELRLGYMATSGAIMNLADEKLTKEIFLNWVESKSSVDWDYGSRKNQLTNPSSGGGGSGDSSTPWKEWGAAYESQYLPTGGTDLQKPENVLWTTKRDRRNALDNLEVVRGSHGIYTHKEGIIWTYDGKEYTTYDVASIEGLIKEGESRSTFNVANREQQLQDKGNIEKGQATLTMLKTKGDDSVSGQLNETFNMSMVASNPTEYFFAPFSNDYKRGLYDPATSDNAGSNDVMLINTRGPNGELLYKNSFKPVINPATGKPYRFKTGSEATQDDLETINKLMLQMGFIKKQTELPG